MLVGARRRRGAHHLHPADIDIEFVGGNQPRVTMLPDLDLPGDTVTGRPARIGP
jgi:hypothetical protein